MMAGTVSTGHWRLVAMGITLALLCLPFASSIALASSNAKTVTSVSHATKNSSVVPVGRYSTASLAPTAAQRNPLLTLVKVRFPRAVQTVGDAITYLLRYSGYALVASDKQEGVVRVVLRKPLPVADRTLGVLTLQRALSVLMGDEVFVLVQDPVHRLVNFHLKARYHTLKSSRGH